MKYSVASHSGGTRAPSTSTPALSVPRPRSHIVRGNGFRAGGRAGRELPRGEVVSGRGDPQNRHDILTGSTSHGTAFLPEPGDRTCRNWTSSSDEARPQVGHHDRLGGATTSWNSVHASRGCSQDALRSTGGDGLFYCFATD